MLPDFLMREPEEPDEEMLYFREAIKRYRENIDDNLIIDLEYSLQEWADMLNECVEKHITIWELWGEPYDPECDY